MFSKSRIPLKVTNITPQKLEHEEKDLVLLKIDCEVEPFAPELAADLDADVRNTLYTRQDAAIKTKVTSISWDLGIPAQLVDLRMAPDQDEPSFTLAEAKVSNLKTKRSGKSNAWRLTFTLTCLPATAHQMNAIIDSYTKTRYTDWEAAQPDLFSDSTKKRTKAVRAERAQGIGEGAPAH